MLLRPAGGADDYEKARKAELLVGDPIDPADVAGPMDLVQGFRRRGTVTRVVRRLDAGYYHEEQLDLIRMELEYLKQEQAKGSALRPESITRLRELNEMMARIFREDREQSKADKLDQMDDAELAAAIRAAAAELPEET